MFAIFKYGTVIHVVESKAMGISYMSKNGLIGSKKHMMIKVSSRFADHFKKNGKGRFKWGDMIDSDGELVLIMTGEKHIKKDRQISMF